MIDERLFHIQLTPRLTPIMGLKLNLDPKPLFSSWGIMSLPTASKQTGLIIDTRLFRDPSVPCVITPGPHRAVYNTDHF